MYQKRDIFHANITAWGYEGMEDKNVIFVDMPPTIKSFVRANPDASFTIVINARLSAELQRKCYLHEMRHINNDDLWSNSTADAIEQTSHK